MNQSIRNYLGVALIILSVFGAFGIVYYTSTYARTTAFSSPAFTVSGEGKVTAIPDVAQFSFSVINEGGKDLGSTQSANTEATNKVIDFLKSNGVDAKDIKTTGYDVSPRYTSVSCGIVPIYFDSSIPSGYGTAGVSRSATCPPQSIVGYTVTQTVQVKVRQLDSVGKLLSGVVDNGANSASSLTFTVDNRTEYENQARAEAIAEAKNKAKAIAEAGGFKIGRLVSVDEYFSGPYAYATGLGGAEDISKDATPPTIEPGSQEITVNVNLRYEIR